MTIRDAIRRKLVVVAICFAACATATKPPAPRWLLILPPVVSYNGAPVATWQKADAFASADECEAYRKGCCSAAIEAWLRGKSEADKYFAIRYKRAMCIASDDPRLQISAAK
jgi:hypothetical protein